MSRSGVAYVRQDTLVWNVKDHGAIGDGVTDDSGAVQALITTIAATANGGTIFFPAGTYLFSSTVTIPTAGKWHLLGGGESGFVQFQRAPQCGIVGPVGTPAIKINNNTVGVTLENLAVEGINAAGLWIFRCAGVVLDNCSFVAVGGAFTEALLIEDTFWFEWRRGAAVAGAGGALPAVKILSANGGAQGSYLLTFDHVTFGTGGVWFRQQTSPAQVIRHVTFRHCSTENFNGATAGGAALFDVGGAVTCNIGAVTLDVIEMSDPVTTQPAIMNVATGCTIGTIFLNGVANSPGIILNGTASCQSAFINGDRFGTSQVAFVQTPAGLLAEANQVFMSDPGLVLTADNNYGGAGAIVLQTRVAGDDYNNQQARLSITADGSQFWGTGAAAADVSLARKAVGRLLMALGTQLGIRTAAAGPTVALTSYSANDKALTYNLDQAGTIEDATREAWNIEFDATANAGLIFKRAAPGGGLAAKLTLAGAVMTLADAYDLAVGTVTGTKIGTAIGQKLGFFGKAPVVQPAAYTVTNPTTDRALNVTVDTLAQGLQVLGTLIADLQSLGLIG